MSASAKDTFEPQSFRAHSFKSGAWRGTATTATGDHLRGTVTVRPALRGVVTIRPVLRGEIRIN